MDKRDHEAILNAFNLARQPLAKRKADVGRADDALQQGMVNVLKINPQVKDVPGYALRTVYNELRRLVKLERRSEQNQTTLDKCDSQPDVAWEERINRQLLVLELISDLEETDQLLVRLYSEGFGWDYIGPIVGLSPNSVKQRCYRLLRELRVKAGREESRG